MEERLSLLEDFSFAIREIMEGTEAKTVELTNWVRYACITLYCFSTKSLIQ